MPAKTINKISWKLRISEPLLRKIERLARQESRTASNMARLLLEEALVARGK